MGPHWQTFFVKLAELTVVRSAKKLEQVLEPGDIFVSSMSPPKSKGLVEKLFRGASQGAQGEWTHVGLYTGNGKITEIRGGNRIRTRALPKAFKGIDAKFMRPNVPAEVREGAANYLKRFAASKKGKAVRYATPGTLIKMMVQRKTPRKLSDKKIRASNRYTCSQLVAEAYDGKVDFSGGKKNHGLVMPVDINRSPKTKDLLVYRNRNRLDRKGTVK